MEFTNLEKKITMDLYLFCCLMNLVHVQAQKIMNLKDFYVFCCLMNLVNVQAQKIMNLKHLQLRKFNL